MKISFSTAALFPISTIEALELLREAGYEFAELMPQCRFETTPDFARDILKLKIKISSIHFPLVYFPIFYNPYKGIIKEAKEIIENLIESARILSSKIIVVHAPPKFEDYKREIFENQILSNINYLCEVGADYDIEIAVENIPESEGETSEGLQDFIRKVGKINIKPMIDTTEVIESKGDIIEFLRNIDAIHLHLSDYKDGEKHLPVGEGILPWKDIITILKTKKYNGFLVLEPSYKYYLKNTLEKLKSSKKIIEDYLIEAKLQ